MRAAIRTAAALIALAPLAQAAPDVLPVPVTAVLSHRQLPPDSLSLYVRDLTTDEVVLRWNDDVPRNPASTIKLLTTLVALDVLGPTYHWHTDVYAMGNVENGRLHGDLLLRGGGDPYLVTERVWQMLRRVRQLGIRDIDGDLLIDDSYFDVTNYDPAAFDNQPLRAYNVAPNALMMNFKVVRYWFEPDPDGNHVRVRLDPPLPDLRIDNRLTQEPGPCRGYHRGISITANDTMDRITLGGRFPAGCDQYAMDRTALSHNAYAYGLFVSLWRDSGGSFDGGWKNVITPADAEPIVEFDSLSLADVIARINKYSNNVMARQLLYTLSAAVLGPPGVEAGGRKVVRDWLTAHGMASSALDYENGAGLSRETRITARDLEALLDFAWRQPYMPEFVASLSLSGLDGTLSKRFDDGVLSGKAHLKTGSLDDVTAIAGYLQARSGHRYALVALQNYTDVHRGPGEEVQEALLKWLYDR
jgi:D-alanyl-D-alanine carboxypeptidase/D-alanyl-D-alanine-endopeptidase (penicillin-binding protein 4)